MLRQGVMVGFILWGAIVLLLFETAAIGSSLQDKLVNFHHLREGRHGKDVHDERTLVLDKASMKQRQGLLDKPTSFFLAPLSAVRGTPHDVDTDWSGPERVQARRILQGSCTEGDSFTITSSAFPSVEGCFSDLGRVTEDGKVIYESSPFAVASWAVFNTTSNETLGSFWFVTEVTSESYFKDFNYCFSAENSTALPHPADATWICGVNGDSELDLPSEFSTTCGCSTTDTTTGIENNAIITSDTEIDTNTTSDSDTTITDIESSATCNEGESFTINSTVLPDLTGCFFDTGSLIEGEVVYSETGTRFGQQNIVNAFNYEDGVEDIRWAVGDGEDNVAECYSLDQATNIHPVEVDAWMCMNESVTAGGFSVSCGCSSGGSSLSMPLTTTTTTDIDTATSITVTGSTSITENGTTTFDIGSTPTTAEMDTATTSDSDTTIINIESAATCNEGESFSINSTVLPDLTGCYFNTGSYGSEGEVVYTETGTLSTQQNAVDAIEVGEYSATEIHWAVGYVTSTNSDENAPDCYSLDKATDVHPVEVETWICMGEFVNAGEFSASCGCSSDEDSLSESLTSSTTTDSEDTTTSDIDTTATDIESAAACSEGQSFTINSAVLPDLTGCYFDTGSYGSEGGVMYSETGTLSTQQNGVDVIDIGALFTTDYRWAVGYITSTNIEENVPDCYSLDQAINVHPAEVETWICAGEFITAEEFSVSCGCSADGGRLSAPLSNLITFVVGFMATVVLLAGV